MKFRTLVVALAVLFGSCFSGKLPAAEVTTEKPAPPSVAELQKQIEQLLEGQQQLRRELQDIKAVLTARETRADVATKPAPPSVISVNVQGELFRGDSQARVAIMEYSDFDCSFCARYARETYPKIDKDYIKTGKVKYFFRDLPAPGETNALLKARAARCAGEQGKFWEMHDRLFAAQSDPASQNMESQAQALGLDLEKFSACLTSGRYSENIRLSVAGARRAGIYGTPAFLIGTVSQAGDFFLATKVLVGGESFETIQSGLDEILTAPTTR